jgi:hypothetical protein
MVVCIWKIQNGEWKLVQCHCREPGGKINISDVLNNVVGTGDTIAI